MRSRKMGEENRVQEPFPNAWRESGSSGFFGLSRLFGSKSERAKPDPRTR